MWKNVQILQAVSLSVRMPIYTYIYDIYVHVMGDVNILIMLTLAGYDSIILTKNFWIMS